MAAIGDSAANDLYALGATKGLTVDDVDAMVKQHGYSPASSASRKAARAVEETISRMRDIDAPAVQAVEDRPVRLASERQVQYIADLLAKRYRSGDGGGFMSTSPYLSNGQINLDAIRRLDAAGASALISSLREEY